LSLKQVHCAVFQLINFLYHSLYNDVISLTNDDKLALLDLLS
jgi:hypothetical protein